MFDAPFSMWKAGVGTSEKNKGVSWSFLLRNAYVMLRLRKTPLQQLVGSIRFSAECLWTHGPRPALDEAKRRWHSCGVSQNRRVRALIHVVWRLSQLHLCVDVANFAPEPADLERIVTHARKKAVHIPSVEEAMSVFALDGGADDPSDGCHLTSGVISPSPCSSIWISPWSRDLFDDDDGEEDWQEGEIEQSHDGGASG